jgi:uncharacterized protein
MKYVHRPTREAREAPYLATVHGKHFEPFGTMTLGESARFGAAGIDLVEVAGETLAIHPESASWAFLNPAEARLFGMLDGLRFGQLANVWPRNADGRVEDFVAQLYRRGLLTIEGQSAVDRRMFAAEL